MVLSLLAIAVLLLAGCVVALFAMFGELYAKTQDRLERQEADAWIREYESWSSPGSQPTYPESLAHLGEAQRAVVLVLSTVCQTCNEIAQDGYEPLIDSGVEFGVVISTSSVESAQHFAGMHPRMAAVPFHVDIQGDWCRHHLGVDISPTAVVLEHGQPKQAWMFSSVAKVAEALHEDQIVHQGTARERGGGRVSGDREVEI